MIIDLPDAGIILVAVLAFLSGLVTLYLYGKTRSVGVSQKIAPTNVERIDYYEKELIDMKIRLDAMELDGETFTKPDLTTKKVESFDVPEVEEPEFVGLLSLELRGSQGRNLAGYMVVENDKPNLGHMQFYEVPIESDIKL